MRTYEDDKRIQLPSTEQLAAEAQAKKMSLSEYLDECIGFAGYMGWRSVGQKLRDIREGI